MRARGLGRGGGVLQGSRQGPGSEVSDQLISSGTGGQSHRNKEYTGSGGRYKATH